VSNPNEKDLFFNLIFLLIIEYQLIIGILDENPVDNFSREKILASLELF